jgi:hypothetical protein
VTSALSIDIPTSVKIPAPATIFSGCQETELITSSFRRAVRAHGAVFRGDDSADGRAKYFSAQILGCYGIFLVIFEPLILS